MGVSVLEYTPRKGIKRLEEVLPKLYLLKIMSTKSFDLNYSISFLNPNVLISNLFENRIFQKTFLKYNFQMPYLPNLFKWYITETSGIRGPVRIDRLTVEVCGTIY